MHYSARRINHDLDFVFTRIIYSDFNVDILQKCTTKLVEFCLCVFGTGSYFLPHLGMGLIYFLTFLTCSYNIQIRARACVYTHMYARTHVRMHSLSLSLSLMFSLSLYLRSISKFHYRTNDYELLRSWRILFILLFRKSPKNDFPIPCLYFVTCIFVFSVFKLLHILLPLVELRRISAAFETLYYYSPSILYVSSLVISC
jgi:hypothetical protein